jgi:hypothetical protein
MWELDDERGAEVAEEGDDLVEWHRVRECQVVDDREAQDEVRPHSLRERRALPRTPPEARRRVGQVEHQREHTLLSVALQVAVQTVDDEVVGVDGHDGGRAGLQGDTREPAIVGAEVEHLAR